MDVLREITEEEFNFFIQELEKELPKTLKNLYYIDSAKKCKEYQEKNCTSLSPKIMPTFYVHRDGLKETCTVFGITSEPDHTVWFYSKDDSLREIRECLKSKYIKWNKTCLFVTICVEQIQPILDHAADHAIDISFNEYASFYTLSPSDASKFEVE
jgi:Domain of unknown function (DUF5645)